MSAALKSVTIARSTERYARWNITAYDTDKNRVEHSHVERFKANEVIVLEIRSDGRISAFVRTE